MTNGTLSTGPTATGTGTGYTYSTSSPPYPISNSTVPSGPTGTAPSSGFFPTATGYARRKRGGAHYFY